MNGPSEVMEKYLQVGKSMCVYVGICIYPYKCICSYSDVWLILGNLQINPWINRVPLHCSLFLIPHSSSMLNQKVEKGLQISHIDFIARRSLAR